MSGFIRKHQLYDKQAEEKTNQIIARVKEAGLHSVRVLFADQHGVMRGKTLMPDQLPSLFEQGMALPSSLLIKDIANRTVMDVWSGEATGLAGMAGLGDILLVPDPDRFFELPHAPGIGWLQADIWHSDGTPSPLDTRRLARQQADQLAGCGLSLSVGLEVEAHIFRIEGEHLAAADATQPGRPPEISLVHQGWQLASEQRLDSLEPVFAIIRQCCAGLGLPLRTLEAEFGPSQIEMTFGVREAIQAADDMVLLRAALRQALARQGWLISFMCRPALPNCFSAGWHLHQSLSDKAGKNLFIPQTGQQLSQTAGHWLAGLLAHGREMAIFAAPTLTGYKRYQPHSLAPDRLAWGLDNRGAAFRLIAAAGDAASRIENRTGEPAANPYLYIASQIASGLDGLQQERPCPPVSQNAYADETAEKLPANLAEALQLMQESIFVQAAFGDIFVAAYGAVKAGELARFNSHVTDFEQQHYLTAF